MPDNDGSSAGAPRRHQACTIMCARWMSFLSPFSAESSWFCSGPSGSGKTTVLSIIGGFVEATSGQVLIGGHDMTRVSPARRPTATVFQDYALFPHLKVEGNVAFGLAMHRMSRRDRPERIRSALAMGRPRGRRNTADRSALPRTTSARRACAGPGNRTGRPAPGRGRSARSISTCAGRCRTSWFAFNGRSGRPSFTSPTTRMKQ